MCGWPINSLSASSEYSKHTYVPQFIILQWKTLHIKTIPSKACVYITHGQCEYCGSNVLPIILLGQSHHQCYIGGSPWGDQGFSQSNVVSGTSSADWVTSNDQSTYNLCMCCWRRFVFIILGWMCCMTANSTYLIMLIIQERILS